MDIKAFSPDLDNVLFAVPYTEILSASLLDKLPLSARIARWSKRRKGGLALALHTCKSEKRRPAQWRYVRLALISEVST